MKTVVFLDRYPATLSELVVQALTVPVSSRRAALLLCHLRCPFLLTLESRITEKISSPSLLRWSVASCLWYSATLVYKFFVGVAEKMLRAVLTTFTVTSCSQFCSEPAMAILLCERFWSKTRDVADAIPVENYLRHALTGDQPLLFEGLASVPPRRCRVLCLSKVDTMVTCCLLWFLRHHLRPIQQFQWCALHPCYPNRADALDEESSTLEIRRSHGVLRTVISRVCYDEKLKKSFPHVQVVSGSLE